MGFQPGPSLHSGENRDVITHKKTRNDEYMIMWELSYFPGGVYTARLSYFFFKGMAGCRPSNRTHIKDLIEKLVVLASPTNWKNLMDSMQEQFSLNNMWVFPKIRGTPKWMVYNGKPYSNG